MEIARSTKCYAALKVWETINVPEIIPKKKNMFSELMKQQLVKWEGYRKMGKIKKLANIKLNGRDISYHGQINEHKKPDGIGRAWIGKEIFFEGCFKLGKCHGLGRMYKNKNKYYTGYFKKNKMSGVGYYHQKRQLVRSNGKVFENIEMETPKRINNIFFCLTEKEKEEAKKIQVNYFNPKQHNWEHFSLLGNGAEGCVIQLIGGVLINGRKFNNVVLKIPYCKSDGIEKVRISEREIDMLLNIPPHPNVLNILGICKDPIGLAFQKMDGDLNHFFGRFFKNKERKVLPALTIALICEQILYGISHIHQNNSMHRDIKPSNILYRERGKGMGMEIRITDFGISKRLLNETNSLKTVVGTPRFVAPEVFSGERSIYTKKCDVYSFGKVMYCLFYPHCLPPNTLQMKYRVKFMENFEKEYYGLYFLMEKCCKKESERPSTSEVLWELKLIIDKLIC